MLEQFSGRIELFKHAYLIFFGELDKTTEKLLQDTNFTNEEDRLKIVIQLASTREENQKHNYAAAEAMCQKAVVEADLRYARTLGNYAIFLDASKKDYAAAEKMYQHAAEAAPENAILLGNYARLLFLREDRSKAVEMLERAEQHQEKEAPDLAVELAFYRYAHCQPQPLSPLKKLLLDGVRSLGWNLTDNVRRAEQDGHPNPALLAALAEVISGNQPIETLEKFEEWSIVEQNT